MTVPSRPTDSRATIDCDGAVTIEVFAAAGKAADAGRTVVLLHDAQGAAPDRPVRSEAAALARAGFRVLLPHYLQRTGAARVGFSEIGRHFGSWRDAVAVVLDRARTDPAPIALAGRSLGGALALAVAARAPEGVAALVVRSAFLPPELDDRALRLPPVLALHGGRDAIVGPSHAVRLHDRAVAAGGTCRVHLYEAQGHAFDPAADADATARTIAYLTEHLA